MVSRKQNVGVSHGDGTTAADGRNRRFARGHQRSWRIAYRCAPSSAGRKWSNLSVGLGRNSGKLESRRIQLRGTTSSARCRASVTSWFHASPVLGRFVLTDQHQAAPLPGITTMAVARSN